MRCSVHAGTVAGMNTLPAATVPPACSSLTTPPAALPVPLPQGHQQHGRHPVGRGGRRSDWLLVAVGRGRQPPSRLVPGLRSIRAAVHGSQLRVHCGSQR